MIFLQRERDTLINITSCRYLDACDKMVKYSKEKDFLKSTWKKVSNFGFWRTACSIIFIIISYLDHYYFPFTLFAETSFLQIPKYFESFSSSWILAAFWFLKKL